MAIVFNELAEVPSETKVALCFTKVFHRDGPFEHSFKFGLIDGESSFRDDMTKVFYLFGSEVAFLEFAVPFVISQALAVTEVTCFW